MSAGIKAAGTVAVAMAGAAAAITGSATGVRAQLPPPTTYYSDTFDGVSGDLNGSTPTQTTGGATWASAAGQFIETPSGTTAPGSVTVTGNYSTLTVGPGAYLPFTVAAANSLYGGTSSIDLRATLNATTELNPSNASTKTDWIALGFTQTENVNSDPSQTSPNGGPWLIYRVNGAVQLFGGAQTNNSFTPTLTFSGPTQFDIVLNTSLNTTTFYAGGLNTTPLDVMSGTVDPYTNFNYVTLGAHRADGNFGSFSLIVSSSAPEPSVALLALGGLPLIGAAVRRRKK